MSDSVLPMFSSKNTLKIIVHLQKTSLCMNDIYQKWHSGSLIECKNLNVSYLL